ncbi:hypothetical protein OOK31_03755 [Streptomyces sp. NBC_00249]|uniref:hypothetical protein n=1 Tax=Streptomyces sp. NBC_00249 TaxID=2975690 RepID=UPI00224F64CE|nr:hypothetical protein [Streptomyces sp. NBC_00249]MCX5193015.1 hypothetical protein [Streptomyces sp. NBC_00249]
MPLTQPHMPRSHRARSRSRHAAAAAPAAGKRAVRRPSLLPADGRLRPSVVCAAAAALVSLLVAARAGALTRVWEFLDYGAGVLSLVSLTATVLWGLAATDRVVLGSGHRLLAQAAHRGLAVAGLAFLALHIWVKVALRQTSAAAAAVPFADADRPVVIGLGTLAGYLFVSVAVSGAVRSVFATKSRSLWWRALHIGAYPAWGASLVHGLKAGRPADAWVTAAYALCLAGVAGVLALRIRSRRAGAGAPARPAAPAPRQPQVRTYSVGDAPLVEVLAAAGPRPARAAALDGGRRSAPRRYGEPDPGGAGPVLEEPTRRLVARKGRA